MDKKLKKYLALAGSVTVGVSSANAQVIYTDVNPDFLLTGNLNTYDLDLNNDGTAEFSLMSLDTLINYVSSSSTYNIEAKGASIRNTNSSNSWVDSTGGISNLSQGANIGSSAQFNNNSSSSYFGSFLALSVSYSYLFNGVPVSNSSYFYGNFTPNEQGILGLKVSINNNIHYGWARVEYLPDGSLSIKDYAYDATPNNPIIAGDNGTGLVGVQEQLNAVTISMLNNNIRIENKGANDDCLMVLTNISGQQILEKQLKDKIEIVDVSEFSTGIYLVKVISDSQSYVKKIYIK
jgi:hypothetical protein